MRNEPPDPFRAAATAYDLFTLRSREGEIAALTAFVATIRAEWGPVLDVGSGSGLHAAWLLDQAPDVSIVALEPSPAMRSLTIAKIAARPDWFERITVRPDDFFSAPLPPRISGAVLLGVLGHFDAMERAALFAELASRLPAGGAALLDLPDPARPTRVDAHEFTVATIGDLTYRGITEGRPVDFERMRWTTTYLTLEGECVLEEATTQFEYRHPSPEVLAAQAEAAGLVLARIGHSRFWLATRPPTS